MGTQSTAANRAPRANAEMVAAAEQFERVTIMLDAQFPDVASALRATREDLLAFASRC